MSRILTILLLAGFLAGMLPPATCRGMDSCCCAKGKPDATAARTGASTAAPKGACPAHARATAAEPASALDSRCPCTPEMRGCAPERDPGTQPMTPASIPPAASTAPPSAHVPALLGAPGIPMPTAIAEPPPLPFAATRHTVLRI
jgi:hypothetical protein